MFFAYIGFDSISTHAAEAIRPQRDVPIAMIASLAICTVLYILVAVVITGMVPYPQISLDSAIATAFRELAEREASPLLRGAAFLIAIGALAGMTSVLLVTFLSQARIFLAMARDGLLPHGIFGDVHPRSHRRNRRLASRSRRRPVTEASVTNREHGSWNSKVDHLTQTIKLLAALVKPEDAEAAARIATLTPKNDVRRELAAKHQPPASWFAEDEVPW